VDDNVLEDVDCLASLEEKIEANFVIFPVPSSDKIFIQINGTEITDYEVVDMNGRSVRKVQGIQESVLILNAADFAKGAYLVHVKTPVGVGVKKMVIE
jgi:precorrin-6B methylase 1